MFGGRDQFIVFYFSLLMSCRSVCLFDMGIGVRDCNASVSFNALFSSLDHHCSPGPVKAGGRGEA